MCHPKRCKTCGKTTWAGCGQHVAQVRAAVPSDQWCGGHDTPNSHGWLRRLLSPGHASE
jgi:hypothetical protein